MMPLLIIPSSLNYIFLFIGLGSFAALSLILHKLIVGPARKASADRQAPPPEEGTVKEIIVDDLVRNRKISIGLQDSDITTRMNGIKEDHLSIRIHKERDMEEYDITLVPGGPVFYRPPHAKKFDPLKVPESFASRELIGHPALLRVVAGIKDNRLLQYLEFELSTKYFVNSAGEEKMKFLITLSRIYPGVDLNSRNKKGIFLFGRVRTREEVPEEAA